MFGGESVKYTSEIRIYTSLDYVRLGEGEKK